MRGARLTFAGLAILLMASSASAIDYRDQRSLLRLDGIWLFHEGDSPAFSRAEINDFGWDERLVPTTYASWDDRWAGRAWYRVHVVLPDKPRQPLALSLGPAREAVEVFVNGQRIGQRGSFRSPVRGGRRAEPLVVGVPSALLKRGDNVFALRVYDPNHTGGFPQGPILFGPFHEIESAVTLNTLVANASRVGLGLLALLAGLAPLALVRRVKSNRDLIWLLLAGGGLAISALGDGGFVSPWLPVDLVGRTGTLGAIAGTIGIGSYIASRYDDLGSQIAGMARIALTVLFAVVLLAPADLLYFLEGPLTLLSALIVTFYCLRLCARALRWDRSALIIFVGLAAQTILLIFDGFTFRVSGYPAPSLVGAVALLTVVAVAIIRQTASEDEDAVRLTPTSLQLDRADETYGLIEASSMPILTPRKYLTTVVRELSRQMTVRRCSLILLNEAQELRVLSSIGLPRQVTQGAINRSSSVAGWVFENGKPLTERTLPESLMIGRPGSSYRTSSFLSVPISSDGKRFGVLSLSDRNDGGSFSEATIHQVEALCQTLGMIINEMPPTIFAVLPPTQEGGTKNGPDQNTRSTEANLTPEETAKLDKFLQPAGASTGGRDLH